MVLPKVLKQFLEKQYTCHNLCLPQHFPRTENFEKFQDGFRVNSVTNENLVSSQVGQWQRNWYVIATNYFADPFYIDFSEENFPVSVNHRIILPREERQRQWKRHRDKSAQ